jgi:hypothetical protein
VTFTGPVDAPAGTVAVIFVEDTTVAVFEIPLNEMVAGVVNPVPVTLTSVPSPPDVGDIEDTVAEFTTIRGPVALAVREMTAMRPAIELRGMRATMLRGDMTR